MGPMASSPVRSPSAVRVSSILALASAAAWALACGGDTPTDPGGNGGGSAVASVEVTPAADTLTAVGNTVQLSARALDANGDEISGVDISWSTSDEGVVTVDDQGVAEAVANGEAEVTASASGVTGSAALAVLQRVDAVTVTPASATLTSAGATQQFSASAADENGNAVDGTSIVWASEDHEVATVDRNGLATAKGSGAVTITATVQDVPGHADLTVNQAIDRLAFRAQPTDVTAGVALDPAVQVEVLDAQGRVVEDAEVAITLAIADDPAGGTLTGTTTVNAVNGVVSFSGLWIDAAAPGYTLEATSTGIPADTSAAFEVLPAAPAQLAYLTSPVDTVAGEPLSVRVAIQDEFGNTVTSSTESVGLDLAQKPEGGSLVGARQEDAVDGVATFDATTLETAGTYVLTAFASGLDAIDSGQFIIRHAAAHHLADASPSVRPGGPAKGVLEGLQVAVHDTFHNQAFNSTAQISLAVGPGDFPGAALEGRTVASAVSGVAVFDSAVLTKPGRYDLVASSSGLGDGVQRAAAFIVPRFPQDLIAGTDHSCVNTTEHSFCWGSNASGQLGAATGAPSGDSVAVATDTDLSFTWTGAGTSHTCGVTAADEAYCWGANADGQLGDGSLGTDRPAPVAVSGNLGLVQVSAGGSHTCAVSTSGDVYCWGANDQGQLGTGGTGAGSDVPVLAVDTLAFDFVFAGDDHTCGLAADSLAYCWGDNAHGQLGDGNLGVDSPSPVLVAGGVKYSWLSAGARHNCAVEPSGDVVCWGDNADGQLSGTGGDSDVPSGAMTGVTSVFPSGSLFGHVSAGGAHSCALRGPGEGVWCWGDNSAGQLGRGSTGGTGTSPMAALGSSDFSWFALAAGGSHTCAFASDDDGLLDPDDDGLFCWGANASGQLGDGTTADANTMSRMIQGY